MNPDQHTPRSAAVLLTRAVSRLDVVQPATAREPIQNMLAAGIEECVGARNLLGKRLRYLLELAQAIVDTPPPDA